MKVAQLMAGAATGGAELFFERLCAGLARSGESVLPLVRPDAARLARLREAGLAPECFPFGGRLDLWTRRRLARRLSVFAPRVAVAWMGRAARHAPPGPWVLVGRLGGYYDLRQFSRCDHLVGNTKGMCDWIASQGWPAERVHRLANFTPDMAGAAPAALGVPQPSKLVLAMGRLHRNKGFDILIAAASRLPAIQVAIAGEGPEREPLERLARQAGVGERVHFLGWREDSAALLAACDVFVCPSRSEPLGNVILEAHSAGRPVVAAMAEGPSALIETGRTGILVAPESAIALAAGIEGVLGNPAMAKSLVDEGRRAWELSFSEAAVVGQWITFLTTVEKAV